MEKLVYQSWLYRNLMPTIFVYNHVNEFLFHVFKNYMIES